MATIDDNLAKAVTEALRQAQIDISNQDKLLVGPGDVTLTRADGTTATGPSWPKMAGQTNAAVQWRGALPSNANLNTYGPTASYVGQWHFGVAGALITNGFPEDSAQGIFEVFNGGPYLGSQRFTTKSGNIYYRNLSGSWNGIDGPWSAWLPVGYSPMPGYFTGDMNTLLSPGNWSITSDVTNGPIPAGQTVTPTGICKVELRSSANSVVQTFTSVATNAAFMNRTWTRTLSGSTWSSWDLQGTAALNDLGLGLTVKDGLTSLDWNQFDFASGQEFSVAAGNMTNTPSEIDTTGWGTTQVCFNVIGIDGVVTTVECWLSHTNNSVFRRYQIRISGRKGSRFFAVRQVFTSTDTIPIANGGTGATTAAAARTALGVAYGTTAGTVAQGNDSRLSTIDGRSGGTLSTPSLFTGANAGNAGNKVGIESLPATTVGGVVGRLSLQYFNDTGYVGAVRGGSTSLDAVNVGIDKANGTWVTWSFASGGNATANNGSWVNNSDERIKTNIIPIMDPLEKMRMFRGCTWDRLDNAPPGQGFIAQELAKAMPTAVFTGGTTILRDGAEVKETLSVDLAGASAALHHEAILAIMDAFDELANEVKELRSELMGGGKKTI